MWHRSGAGRVGPPRALAGVVLAAALTAAGCGAAGRVAGTTTAAATTAAATRKPAAPKLRVGVVGALQIATPGVEVVRRPLAAMPALPLVLVSSDAAAAAQVAAVARLHPSSHYALVGASSKPARAANLTGLVFRDDQAARLAGVVAGLVLSDGAGGAGGERAAWIGPQERPLASAARRGLHSTAPRALLLRQWTSRIPARCKEGALTAIGRGATIVIAHGGLCAEAVLNAAHEQGLVGLRLTDFELPSVAASWIAGEALHGIYHGGDDVVFGLRSGALGIRSLDPAIPSTLAVRARGVVQELVSGARP